jgi:hypothetical protein
MTRQMTAGTAADGFRIPEPRQPAEQRREVDDPSEPGARRPAETRTR